jgi:hypothetical protein
MLIMIDCAFKITEDEDEGRSQGGAGAGAGSVQRLGDD